MKLEGLSLFHMLFGGLRQSILQALAEQSRIVRLPLNKIGSINKINRAFSDLEQKFGRPPTPDEIAESLELPLQKLSNLLKIVVDIFLWMHR